MKKLLSIVVLLGLCAFGNAAFAACPIDRLQNNQYCGGAAPINETSSKLNNANEIEQNNLRGQNLKEMLQTPNTATPYASKNGFPIMRQNCMFGACLPDLR